MKKFSLRCSAFLLAAILFLPPVMPDVKAAGKPDTAAVPASFPVPEIRSPRLAYTELAVREKSVLDEALCDFVSEDVVCLMDAGIDYTISEWVEKSTHTYLFFDKDLPDGTLYTACGYARTANGGYVYFELSSPEKLTEETVNFQVKQAFSGPWNFETRSC